MKVLAVQVLLIISFISLSAQRRIGKEVSYLYRESATIDKELTLDQYLPGEMLWAYKDYSDARVFFKNGTETRAKINFNYYTDEVFFLTPEMEPMALANTGEVRRILVDDTIWLPYKEIFGKQIYRQDSYTIVRLLQTRILTYRKSSKVGEITKTVSPMQTYTLASMEASNQQRMTLALGEYVFVTSVSFILVSDTSKEKADARGFRKMFPSVRKGINNYNKSFRVDFKNENEVIDFLKACIKMTELK